MKRVLILEPYYGGSHRLFLKGLQQTVEAEYTLLSLPARKWKQRMQLSAFWFVQEIKKIAEGQRWFDTVLCSTFVDVAVLRALISSVSGWNPKAQLNTYFHENQFAYPGQLNDPTIRHFAAINFKTAMASDRCAFNSKFNLDSFLAAVQFGLNKAADIKLPHCVDEIREKSVVLYPGMNYSSIDTIQNSKKAMNDSPQTIVWNHRWEHDKGPELFFDALYQLQEKGVAFHLVVLGESFRNAPPCFEEARKKLAGEIVHFGYAEDREEYARLLYQADLIVSTARHEFFGISILEGIRAGCYPLLPADLSYPELYDEEFLYAPGKLFRRLKGFLESPVNLGMERSRALTNRFDWQQSKNQYVKWLFGT